MLENNVTRIVGLILSVGVLSYLIYSIGSNEVELDNVIKTYIQGKTSHRQP